MKTTLNTPIDVQTVLTIAFFKKIQVKPDVNLICTDWLRLPATSELKDVYHHIRKGTYLEIKKSSSNPFNYNLNIFYKKYFIGNLQGKFNQTVSDLLTKSKNLLVRVNKTEQEKFMPTQNIQVKIFKS